MRKWMRERMKRRKTPQDTAAAGPAQAPLQPSFYDVETPAQKPAAESAVARTAAREAPAPSEPEEAEAGFSEAAGAERGNEADSETPSGSQGQRTRRRRRGRGGRGRSPRPAGSAAPPKRTVSEPTGAEPTGPIAEDAEKPPASPAAAAAQPAAPPAPRPSKGVVVLAIGLPGSGKSSWFKRHNITPLSSDLLRTLLFDDAQEQRFQDLVFSNLRSMLKARLIARRPLNYVDATNLTPQERHGWIKLAKDFGYEVQAVFFDVPLEVCLERNQRRQRAVAEDVMRRMAAKLKAPAFEEGLSKVTVVRVKKKEAGPGPADAAEIE